VNLLSIPLNYFLFVLSLLSPILPIFADLLRRRPLQEKRKR
jgi:hypothetical protein